MKRLDGKLIREFLLAGHDSSHPAELREHGPELVVWYIDVDVNGKPEKVWKIFLAGPTCERYRK